MNDFRRWLLLALFTQAVGVAIAAPLTRHERAWIPITGLPQPATSAVELRDIGTDDPDRVVAEQFPHAVLLGKTIVDDKNADTFHMREHAMKVGATHVLWWGERSTSQVDGGQNTPQFAVTDGITTDKVVGAPSSLDRTAMKVTTGRVSAVYLRDCDLAPCATVATTSPAPAQDAGALQEPESCEATIRMHQLGYDKLTRKRLARTSDAVIEAVTAETAEAEIQARQAGGILVGKSAVVGQRPVEACVILFARQVGATHALWWRERGNEIHVAYLRNCRAARC